MPKSCHLEFLPSSLTVPCYLHHLRLSISDASVSFNSKAPNACPVCHFREEDLGERQNKQQTTFRGCGGREARAEIVDGWSDRTLRAPSVAATVDDHLSKWPRRHAGRHLGRVVEMPARLILDLLNAQRLLISSRENFIIRISLLMYFKPALEEPR